MIRFPTPPPLSWEDTSYFAIWSQGLPVTMKDLVQAFWTGALPPAVLARLDPSQQALLLAALARHAWERVTAVFEAQDPARLKAHADARWKEVFQR